MVLIILLGLLHVGDYIFDANFLIFFIKEIQTFDQNINDDGYKTFSGREVAIF